MSFFLFFDENVLRHSYAVFSPRGRKEKKGKERIFTSKNFEAYFSPVKNKL